MHHWTLALRNLADISVGHNSFTCRLPWGWWFLIFAVTISNVGIFWDCCPIYLVNINLNAVPQGDWKKFQV